MRPKYGLFLNLNTHAFLAGALFSFTALVLAGRLVSHTGYIEDFQRFYRHIGLETYFFPTSSLLESLALDYSTPEQTLVLIGGSSVFNGVKQPRNQIWTQALQQELGPDYRVFNFAFRGSYPTDSGAVAAEILRAQGRKVIYVADLAPGVVGEPDGRDIYRYLFWDAHYKGLLGKFPMRNEYLQTRVLPEAEREGFDEMKRAMWLNSFLHSVDFWNYATYSWFSSFWSPSVIPFIKPRRFCLDSEKEPPPVPERYREGLEEEMRIVRGTIAQSSGRAAEGDWEINPAVMQLFVNQAAVAFKPEDRRDTILVITGPSPWYKGQLSSSDREKLQQIYSRQQQIQEKEGFSSINATEDLNVEDYGDRCHLSPSGGRKIAHLVAEKIRELNKRLPDGK